jgi:hypothetical protein
MFAHRKKPERRSPLKAAPLRNPGQSLDEEIRRLMVEDFTYYLFMAGVFLIIALMECIRWLSKSPPSPLPYLFIAAAVLAYAGRKAFFIKRKIRNLEQGREGEKAVGQYLDRLRGEGYQIFHDIVAGGFNLDHVLVGPSGVYAIETKTISKPPNGKAIVEYDGDKVTVAGFEPDRDPVQQVKTSARWLQELIEESTGKKFKVRPVILYPGWFVTKQPQDAQFWVLNPKALPAFLKNENTAMSTEDVHLVSYHLSRHIRTCK